MPPHMCPANQYTTDAKSDRRFCRFIDRAKLLSNGRANWIDAVDVVDLSSWLPRRQIVAASTLIIVKFSSSLDGHRGIMSSTCTRGVRSGRTSGTFRNIGKTTSELAALRQQFDGQMVGTLG
ncbi:hypothetical protein PCANC_27509 [Puccinia coronata f. sp. avenae]|uniref:Uncharacterized protein n=1 Tax=Puccinia coronata f. sp. avenae TaxID=200324 RepID=A0A2N5RVB7_9BASI|nr:hypothetical protein PCANC_27509 [Puccinia coronata f. sp. avenae]